MPNQPILATSTFADPSSACTRTDEGNAARDIVSDDPMASALAACEVALLSCGMMPARSPALAIDLVVAVPQRVTINLTAMMAALTALARALFQMDAVHVEIAKWRYCHIDWEAAATALFAGDGGRNLLEVDGHWFDALAQAPVLAG